MKNSIKILGLLFMMVVLSFTKAGKEVVVIDVGHGGNDKGAVYGDVNEKDILLNVAQELKKQSAHSNYEFVLMRDSDVYQTLSERAEKINTLNPKYVISLHANMSKNKDKGGYELYVNSLTEANQSKDLAENIKSAKLFEDAEIKEANLYLLRNVKTPITVFEIGYISNEKDRTHMTSEEGQKEIVQSIIEAFK